MSIRVLLADDHAMFREALRALLEKAEGIAVVGEASDGDQLEALVDRLTPDMVVMDVSMPTVNGIEATRRLLASHPRMKIVALSAYLYKRFVFDMLDAGALGYVSKSNASEELVRAIFSAAKGKLYVCQEAAAMLADVTLWKTGTSGHTSKKDQLGRREREILALLAEGNNTREIAGALHIAATTVNVHRRNIMRKLDLHTVAELTKYAIREGLISP